jgi:N-acetylglucosamine kinase-like BadF-type ATPase
VIFVGLDCGGSTTRALAVDERGEVLFRGLSGPANLANTPKAKLCQHLAQATAGCPRAASVCGCFAGLINDETRILGETVLREIFPEAAIRAEPDFAAALYAAPDGTDVCVVAGTGSLVCSRRDGKIVKSGGRGYVLGDFGSAYQLGRDALIRYLDDPLWAGEPLRHALVEAFGGLSENVVVGEVYASGTPSKVVAGFGKFLVSAAQAGEPWALERLDFHMDQLAQVVRHHVDCHFTHRSGLQLALAGGVWSMSPITVERFRNVIDETKSVNVISVQKLSQPPVTGAVRLAREQT